MNDAALKVEFVDTRLHHLLSRAEFVDPSFESQYPLIQLDLFL